MKKSLVPDKNFAIDCAGYWDSSDFIGLNLSLPLDISGKWPINFVGILGLLTMLCSFENVLYQHLKARTWQS